MPTVKSKNKTKTPKKSLEPNIAETLMEPGDYEVTPEHTFEVEIYLTKKRDRWVVMGGKGKGIETHRVLFRLWTYDEMVVLKKQATSYDNVRRIHMVDQDALNRLKVQKLMMEWSFGDNNPRLKIHRVQGVLSDESWMVFKKLQTNIIDFILRGMNEVLEYNG